MQEQHAPAHAGLIQYTHDYTDFFPPNPDDGNTTAYYNWVGGEAGLGQGNEYDPDILKDPKRSLLAPYQGTNVSLYHCPADMRPLGFANGQSALGTLKGTKIPKVRSVSMSQAVGTNPYKKGKTVVDGPGLDGAHTHVANQMWYTFAKPTDMRRPGPANTLVILDENKYSLNDASFATVGPREPPNYLMVDWLTVAF